MRSEMPESEPEKLKTLLDYAIGLMSENASKRGQAEGENEGLKRTIDRLREAVGILMVTDTGRVRTFPGDNGEEWCPWCTQRWIGNDIVHENDCPYVRALAIMNDIGWED